MENRDSEDLEKASSPSSQLQGRMNCKEIILLPSLIFKLALIPGLLDSRLCYSGLGQCGHDMKEKTRYSLSTCREHHV